MNDKIGLAHMMDSVGLVGPPTVGVKFHILGAF